MQKNLVQIFKDKGIKTQAQKTAFVKANTIVVLTNNSGHSYGPPGSVVSWYNANTYYTNNGSALCYLRRDSGGSGNTIGFTELTVKGYMEMTKEGLNAELNTIKKEQTALTKRKKDANDKLAFLKEAGVDGFSDNEYKAYMTLKTLEKKDITDIEKAKIIAALIDG